MPPLPCHGRCPVTTQLYDKRRRPEFASVQIVRFPHITSNLSVRCKYNIIIGQFHRFRRILLEKSNFVDEIALLLQALMDRGYKQATLRRKLKRQLEAWPGVYDSHPPALLQGVDRRLAELLNG